MWIIHKKIYLCLKTEPSGPPVVVECRKPFNIINNYRYPMGLQVIGLAEWNATFFCGCYDYNFDYVTCCGQRWFWNLDDVFKK